MQPLYRQNYWIFRSAHEVLLYSLLYITNPSKCLTTNFTTFSVVQLCCEIQNVFELTVWKKPFEQQIVVMINMVFFYILKYACKIVYILWTSNKTFFLYAIYQSYSWYEIIILNILIVILHCKKIFKMHNNKSKLLPIQFYAIS